jgi:hypothetical protein
MPEWRGNQRREARNQGQRLKLNRTGAIGPWFLELQLHVSVGQDVQAVVGQWRSQDIATQSLATGLVVGGYSG